jgi:hypothetical protein
VWEAARHERVCDGNWDESRARQAIERIANDTVAARGANGVWPAHPDDDPVPGARTGIYFGAAGIGWAIEHLASRGLCSGTASRACRPEGLHDLYVESPEGGERVPSYMLGEVGLLAVTGEDPDRLYELIESNIEHPSLELLWGAPGTMIPALGMYRDTGDDRWRELWLRNARHLLSQWRHQSDVDCRLWTQDLYGEIVRLLGAGHGFAWNAGALLAGIDLLDPNEADELVTGASRTLVVTARREDGRANWSPHVGRPRHGREAMLVQWCHGAPGMLTSLAGLPRTGDSELDTVLLEGGELIWAAGPLSKGPGLCHGTAGNGYAFLALYRRTGDSLWLDRARRFAVHAAEQSRAARERHGFGRYSLWAGDLGVAVYLADCIEGRFGMPLLDTR